MRKLLLLVAVATLFPCVTRADEPAAKGADEAAINIQEIMMKMGGAMEDEEPDAPYPPFDKVTKGMESDSGMFKLWSYPPGSKEQDSEKLLCEIPSSMLGQQFMLSTSVSGGGFFTGFPLTERVVKWELHDRQLLLIEPETRFVINKSKEVSDVVRRTYPDRILVAVPVVTKSPGGSPVIDFGRLLKSSFADVGWMSGTASFFGQGSMGGGINPSLSEWTKKKVFPENVEIGVALAMSRFSPPGSYDKTLVHFSFWKLPETGYNPRIADDRVGYFLTTNRDWSKPTDARDLFNRYINRWQLEKRDSSLAMCEPKQPIIYYIEKTVPVRFRRAVRDGILEWNKAFEKVGYLNAVQVRQQTDDNEWKDLDPEDMRYSFFRWIVADSGFAMGPSRANPFTGQIYDADIIFADAMVRHFEQSADQMLPDAMAESLMTDPTLDAFFDKYPQFKRPHAGWDELNGESEAKQMAQQRDAAWTELQKRGHAHVGQCDYLEGMKHQMAISHAMLAGQPKEVIDRFLYDAIKEVVAHEVGHTLGLRHNFKASSIYSVEEIAKRRATDEPTCGSVMDYNPVLFFKEDATEGHFVTPVIGPYDYWAIEYGYRSFDSSYKSHKSACDDAEDEPAEDEDDAKDAEPKADLASADVPSDFDMSQIPPEVLEQLPPEAKAVLEKLKSGGLSIPGAPGASSGSAPKFAKPVAGEEAMLKDIASRSTEPELAYATDEDTTFLAPDPLVNRFDMGSDAMEWATKRIEVIDGRLANIMDWAVEDGESWYYLRDSFQRLMMERMRLLEYVGRFIGGQYFNRAHRGEGDKPPFEIVEPERQRKALNFIHEQLLGKQSFDISPELLNHFAPSRWSHAGTQASITLDYPVRSLVSTMQWWTLFDRFFPNNLRRIHDAELKAQGPDKFTLAEYLRTLQATCWSEVLNPKQINSRQWSTADPFISDVRRSLQREYLEVVEPLVRMAPGTIVSPDIHAMLQQSMRELSVNLGALIETGKGDFASLAHINACKSRIDRMLSPELREYGY